MARNLTPEEVLKEIDFTIDHKATIDEFGFGHRNIVVGIIVREKLGETYCGRPLPEELVENAQKNYRDWTYAQRDLDRFSIPDFDELRKKIGYRYSIIHDAKKQGLITGEQARELESRREGLLHGPLRHRFLELGEKTRQLHDDYVEFLRDCLPQE